MGYVSGDQYYGAKASMNVWAPRVANQYEFSLSQMWVISGSFGDDLNTIEAGWQACYFSLKTRYSRIHYTILIEIQETNSANPSWLTNMFIVFLLILISIFFQDYNLKFAKPR